MNRSDERRHDLKSGLRWGAAGAVFAAIGATVLFKRKKAGATADPQLEFAAGRGTRAGPVDRPSLDAGYEVVDTDVRALVKVMVCSIAIGIVGLAFVFWMFARFNTHYQNADTGLTSQQSAGIVPPLPHLQADPYRDIDATLMEQRQRIETYGWDDTAHSRAHIPVQRAMRQIVGKSLDADVRADQTGSPEVAVPVVTSPAAGPAPAQDKPANRVQGEGRPGSIVPSYDPRETPEAKP